MHRAILAVAGVLAVAVWLSTQVSVFATAHNSWDYILHLDHSDPQHPQVVREIGRPVKNAAGSPIGVNFDLTSVTDVPGMTLLPTTIDISAASFDLAVVGVSSRDGRVRQYMAHEFKSNAAYDVSIIRGGRTTAVALRRANVVPMAAAFDNSFGFTGPQQVFTANNSNFAQRLQTQWNLLGFPAGTNDNVALANSAHSFTINLLHTADGSGGAMLFCRQGQTTCPVSTFGAIDGFYGRASTIPAPPGSNAASRIALTGRDPLAQLLLGCPTDPLPPENLFAFRNDIGSGSPDTILQWEDPLCWREFLVEITLENEERGAVIVRGTTYIPNFSGIVSFRVAALDEARNRGEFSDPYFLR
jgi:hypothetical protein